MKKGLLLIFPLLLLTCPVHAARISFLVIESDSFVVKEAIESLNLQKRLEVDFFTYQEIKARKEAERFIKASDVVIVDVMMKDLADYVLENVDLQKTNVYALRGSRDDDVLRRKGFIFDPEVMEYYRYLNVRNVKNLILKVAHKEFDNTIHYQPVSVLPRLGIYHPLSGKVFEQFKDYLKWYKEKGRFKPGKDWIGLTFFSSSLSQGQKEAIDHVIEELESSGLNVLACYGKDMDILKRFFMDKSGGARVDIILAFSLKFYSALNQELRSALVGLNVPVINAITLYSTEIEKWRKDPIGIPPLDVVWSIANPEISGAIEPTPLSGRTRILDKDSSKLLFVRKPVKETLQFLIPRIKKWLALRKKPNSKKRLAILFYNHSQGKQNIGASYLNVFKSIKIILNRLGEEGYNVGDVQDLNEGGIKELILKYARNIGSWAPGELEKMIQQGNLIQVPMETYKNWFGELDDEFQKRVLRQWGRPEESTIMVNRGNFIIPAVIMGNVVLMPEPSRGWGDDPMKLYHDPTLFPHHQYIAAYLWLEKVFGADAMVHLGTHATHEWLPGKQAGLRPSCPPEVLITTIPNIYPYIVDDVGEGIQAKRRGRGVVIDHLTPAVKQSGLYEEYARLYEMINDYNQALSMGSATSQERFKIMEKLIQETGLMKDLSLSKLNEDALHKVEHYLLEIRESFMPYGLHTFGVSPGGEALKETARAILDANPKQDEMLIREALRDSGPSELMNLLNALKGGYVPSGEGNDPLRNPSAIPTGKNFYGFNPQKIPSPSAWVLGKKAAQEIIRKNLKERGTYPQKVAVVLWATETIRNQGINESTILFLMGLRPVWDRSGRVTGVAVIPGKELGRPRIDVLINPSGLYRDLFPNLLLLLDRAVQKAAIQRDIENLIAKHSRLITEKLMESGVSEKLARKLSMVRIFTEKPGSYGTGVSEMASTSGIWASDEEIVDVYENRVGYAFGMGIWGEEARELFKQNLKAVDVAVHSISSNVYGTMDNDDMFQYLGGLHLAVKRESGKAPETFATMQRIPNQVRLEPIAKTVGRELRVRYLNPKWIEGMKKENYAGAREMAKFVEYLWGWQVTTPSAIGAEQWDQVYQVYVEDKYHLGLKDFFDRENPWAFQSITARMLEATRKGYWNAPESVKRKLAVEYAMNVVQKGVACCDHTCNNPLLNQMVVNIISIPGLISPRMVERFRIAIEQAMKSPLSEQVQKRKELIGKLKEGFERARRYSSSSKGSLAKKTSPKERSMKDGKKIVEGFKMEEVKPRDTETEVSSSGVQWFAGLFVALIIAAVLFGAKRYR